MSSGKFTHELWVDAAHFVAAKIVLAGPEFSNGDRQQALTVLAQTTDKLIDAGYDPERGRWLPPKNTETEYVDGPSYGIPQIGSEYGVPITADDYRKAIMQLYSSLLMSDPRELFS